MRNILVLTSHHPSRRNPTNAIYGYYTYRALAKLCRLELVAPFPFWMRLRHPGDIVHPPRERWDDVEIAFAPYFSVPGLQALHGLAVGLSLERRVAALRRHFPFEAILSAWAFPDAVGAALLAARFGVPLVTTVLGSDINAFGRRRDLAFQIRRGLGRAQRVVAVSEALGDAVVKLGIPRERVVVQHNGVDGEVFALRDRRAVRAELGVAQDRALVGYVGNLFPEKGPDVLVEAMGRLSARGDRPIDCAIIGGGTVEADLKARIAELGLGERVRFLGRKVHDEVPRWISAFDVLCLPSRREGCPNVILEALASGRPVVASAVGGVPELLRKENGILVPPDRPDVLADALEQALGRTWDEQALRETLPSPSWDSVGAAYARLLDEVISAWR